MKLKQKGFLPAGFSNSFGSRDLDQRGKKEKSRKHPAKKNTAPCNKRGGHR